MGATLAIMCSSDASIKRLVNMAATTNRTKHRSGVWLSAQCDVTAPDVEMSNGDGSDGDGGSSETPFATSGSFSSRTSVAGDDSVWNYNTGLKSILYLERRHLLGL